ncbi:fimbrin [Acrasis kona]|uniref:Fimbrin n=1 Tax=Acrasis kona TaxID=1008807 RepID=A0AAW2YHG2_9EUKA
MSKGLNATNTDKITQIKGEGSGIHSYSHEETEAFTEFINDHLSKDAQIGSRFPITPEQLFDSVQDGVLLCKLLNVCVPGTIDERVINVKAKLNPWEVNENHTLAINSAKGIGCSIVNIGQNDLNEGRPHIVLGLVWQVIKIGLLQDINLKQHPELVRLLLDGEELSDLLKLSPEALLIRWVNYHLKEAESQRRIKNFTEDIKDSEVYTILLKQICPNNECDLSPLNESDLEQRAELMLQQANKLDCRKFVKPRDVVKGNQKLNLAYTANLFNSYPALNPINKEDYDFAELLDFDGEGTREEKVFRLWMQSLGLDVNNLFEDLRDGSLLLKLIEKINPGAVDWKSAKTTPKNKFEAVQNTNYVINLAKQFNLSTVNVGGVDIYEKNKKLILGIVWQLMRLSLVNTLKELGGGKKVDDQAILNSANSKVPDDKISSFQDPKLKTGVFLIKLCKAISERSVNMDLVTSGETEADAAQNAKYAISVARKIGAPVFLLYEDIVEIKPKMILAFVASLLSVKEK